MIALLLLVACAPKAPVRELPAPLPTTPFVTPKSTEGKLKNGVRVVVIENHEVPLVWLRLALTPGSFTDPAGKEGLAAVTMDMLNEGAGKLDAAGISGALKHLGSDLGSSAWDDGAAVTAQSLSRNLAPTLDLVASVLREPTFADADWELMRKQRLADLQRARKDPDAIATRVYNHVLFGDAYSGRLATETSYGAITTADMKAWWDQNVRPENAIVLVGGDTTVDQIVPLLDARLGDWAPKGPPVVAPAAKPVASTPAIQLVDRPGAAQSMLRVGGYVDAPTEADWFDLVLANQAVGGQFTARINMNLREDKGYTYGARSQMRYDFAGGNFVASAGVHTDKTTPALTELFKELRGPGGDRPLTEAEVGDAQSSLVYAWPLRFESPDFLLGQVENVWRYHLPDSWIPDYLGHLQAVTPAKAQTAWTTRIHPETLTCVVVGDAGVIGDSLTSLGLPIVRRDADGNLVPQGASDGH